MKNIIEGKSYKETFVEKLLRFLHPIVLKGLVLATKSIPIKIDGEIFVSGPPIFVANHFGIDDIPTAGKVIGEHTYVLVSDEDKGTLNGLALSMNGCVWINRLNKAERKYAGEALNRHLQLGHNVLMYPEATWNLSPNLLMLPMYWGCIELSLKTGIPIVPLYFYFTDNVCYAQINRPFYPSSDKVKSIAELRDIMATSAWKIIEKYGIEKRKDLEQNYLKKDIDKRYSKYRRASKDPVGVQKYEEKFIFRPKGYVDYPEAFSFFENMQIRKSNLFLFKDWLKYNSGYK